MPRYQANGQLLLPAMRDMHIHLDKTFYGGPWQAPRPRQGKTIMDMIALEQKLLPQLLPTSQQRAEALIALLHSKGTTVARSHCNIDPVSGLKSLEHLQRALENHRDDFSCEIVAFPQHGLLHSKVDGLMREAMQHGRRNMSAGWIRPMSTARWRSRSTRCSRSLSIPARASTFTCTRPARPAPPRSTT